MAMDQANQHLLNLVHTQIGEMELVRSKIYQLETTHRQKIAQYILPCSLPAARASLTSLGTRRRLRAFTASLRLEEARLKVHTADLRSRHHRASATDLRISSKASWQVEGKEVQDLRRRLKINLVSQACQVTCKAKVLQV